MRYKLLFLSILFINTINAQCIRWKIISSGEEHSLGLKTDGTLWSWGNNDYGQLGLGSSVLKTNTPTQVGNLNTWIYINAGHKSYGIKNDGTLWAWGFNGNYRLGDGTLVGKNTPIQIGNAFNWKTLSSGKEHCLAIKNDGSLFSWGNLPNSLISSLISLISFISKTITCKEIYS